MRLQGITVTWKVRYVYMRTSPGVGGSRQTREIGWDGIDTVGSS